MKEDYTINVTANAAAPTVFKAINQVNAWWSTDFEGASEKLNDVFTVRFGETFITLKIVELVPEKKIVWYVMDCNKPWLKNKKEWNGTQISWALSEKDEKTGISFTHHGLVPEIECYGACSNAWGEYIHGSLLNLVHTGKG